MNIFISWSGERSHRVALALKEWLPWVIQAVKPYVSSEDIDKGSRWFKDISVELEKSDFGIICITPENQNEPWLAFEAGALSKKLDASRVCPLVIDLAKTDLVGPLAQFQATQPNKEDLRALVRTINGCLDDQQALDKARLEQSFERWWQDLEGRYQTASEPPEAEAVPQPRQEREILEEVLELARTINRHTRPALSTGLFSGDQVYGRFEQRRPSTIFSSQDDPRFGEKITEPIIPTSLTSQETQEETEKKDK